MPKASGRTGAAHQRVYGSVCPEKTAEKYPGFFGYGTFRPEDSGKEGRGRTGGATPAAEEFSQRFEEILIDEYQDSNLVQETLLQSVSRLRHGKYNIFMVGDVKQSIYRFRLARPELFMEKYETYTSQESERQKIDLHKNFRSRPEVLSGVNYIFEQIMGKELGDVEYDEAAALYPGANFPPYSRNEDETFPSTEIWIAETDTQELADLEEESTAQELEARMIGQRIQEIVGQAPVLDKKTGEYRPAQYRDCVILLRTVAGWAETFVSVLMDMGIPAYATSKTGYFSAPEMVTLLNYLHICDNPMQEIPFTGVLASPLVGCTPEELAMIKNEFPQGKIYEAHGNTGKRDSVMLYEKNCVVFSQNMNVFGSGFLILLSMS